MPKTRTRELKLFVDGRGILWFGDGTRRACASNLDPRSFVRQDWLQDFDCIRLLGFPTNDKLICELLTRRGAAPEALPQSIQLGTPAVCPTVASRSNPDIVMRQMAEVHMRPSSLGGWHEIGLQDAIQYGLRHELSKAEGEYTQSIDKLLHMHPAWPAISFIPSHDPHYSAMLLSVVLDPRWYGDVSHPNRVSKLYSFLGMMERNMAELSVGSLNTGKPGTGMYIDRADVTFRAWSCGAHKVQDNNTECFLWRILREAPTKPKGILKACKRFISFIRQVWLNAIAPPGRTLFVPEYFFEHSEETEAYRHHLKQIVGK